LAIARAREHPDVIVGVKVRLGYQMGEQLSGRIRDVLLGGRVLVRHGRYAAQHAAGTYLSRGGAGR
jgi:hypothetical protein